MSQEIILLKVVNRALMSQPQTSTPNRTNRRRNMAIAGAVILTLILASSAVLYLRGNFLAPIPFDYHLEVNPTSGIVQQGNSLLTNITLTYVQGSPETVTLGASGGPDGAIYSFSNPKGTPTFINAFTSNLTISIPSSTATNSYSVNVTATANNGKIYFQSYTLTVLDGTIQVSGTVAAKSSDDIYPTQIQFVNTATNLTYTAIVKTTAGSPPTPRLIQQGTYVISLPNQQSYHVICTWTRLVGPWVSPSDAVTGIFDGGTLYVNVAVGVTSMTRDFSG